jgi:peptide/nickel transport system permease protein
LPWTIAIQLPSLIIGWIVGNILGAVAAYRKGIFDRTIFPLSLFFSSIPVFVLALLMKYYLGVYAHWFPMQGAYDAELMPSATFTFYWSLFRHWQPSRFWQHSWFDWRTSHRYAINVAL